MLIGLKNVIWGTGIGAAALFACSVGLADVAPPDDYVETCTLENKHNAGNECIECNAWASMGLGTEIQDGQCQADVYEKDGYKKACQTAGASAWNEIWCRSAEGTEGGDAAKPVDNTVDSDASGDDGCSVVRVGSEKGTLFELFRLFF